MQARLSSSKNLGTLLSFWRWSPTSWEWHVGFYLDHAIDLAKVFCLGGDQGNLVSVEGFGSEKVIRYQRLIRQVGSDIPKPRLKLGSKGKEVFRLQKLLNATGYNCGDVDGDFGPMTENVLKLFQADNALLVNGI